MYYHHSHQLRYCHEFSSTSYIRYFILNVAGDLPDLQAPPRPCSIKNKTDSDNIEPDDDDDDDDDDDNNNNNNINNNYIIIIIAIIIKITIIIQINKRKQHI